ncbi:MAG: PAS domain S-box protein [Gammaproteobacteria bacterium]
MVDPEPCPDRTSASGTPPPGQAEILDLAHVLIRDTDDRIVFWNAGAGRLYGWTRDEALGQVSHSLFQTRFPKPLAAIRTELWRDGQWEGELSHRTRQGERIAVASHWILYRDDQGQPCAILEVNNDITDLKRSEQTIQHLNTALANAMPGIFRVDAQGRFVEVNEHFALILGYATSELLGKDWRLTLHPEDQDVVLQAYRRLLDHGRADLEIRGICKDGSAFDEHLLLVAVNDDLGLPAGHYGFMRDITQHKREAQLHQSRERLRTFAIHLDSALEAERIRISREIHDELGQALTSLAIDLAWLDQRVVATPVRRVAGMRQKIAAMAGLVDGLIADIRRIASELRPSLLEKVGLAAAVETHARQFQERTGIRCTTAFDAGIDLEQERAVGVFRIYQEAMINVARHAGAAHVEIRLTQREAVFGLEVEDDGCGITEADARDPSTQGILGMEERARILGGSLSVRGIAGCGTLVSLHAPDERRETVPPCGKDLSAREIELLVVDDHPLLRQGVKQILTESPLRVACHEVQDAATLRACLQTRNFDLVLLDLSLPDQNGIECLREIKRLRPRLPVLVLSMYADQDFALPALKAGAAGYLTKDRAPRELLTAVKKVLAGEKYFSPGLSMQIAVEFLDGAGQLPHERLSRQEFRIMLRIATGAALTAIAEESALSPKTVSTYRSRILQKMGLKTNADLVQYCTRHTLIK